jgi:hypothetical protein
MVRLFRAFWLAAAGLLAEVVLLLTSIGGNLLRRWHPRRAFRRPLRLGSGDRRRAAAVAADSDKLHCVVVGARLIDTSVVHEELRG